MANLRVHPADHNAHPTGHNAKGCRAIDVVLHRDLYPRQRETDDGPMGGVGHQAVQCVPGSLHLVPRAHGQRHLVAHAGFAKMSESNGAADVPTALHPRNPTLKVNQLISFKKTKTLIPFFVDRLTRVCIWPWTKRVRKNRRTSWPWPPRT